MSDPDIDELNVVPKKLAALVVVSNELIADSDRSALQVVDDGLVRDLQVRLDAAYFGSTVADSPNGLGSLTSVQHVSSGGSFADLDARSPKAYRS